MAKYALLDKSGKTRLTTEANTAREAGRNFEGRREAPLPKGWTIVKREAKPTTKPKAEPKKADRPRVGDTVRVVGHAYRRRQFGELIEDDNSDNPFLVRFGDGAEWWYPETSIKVTIESPKPKHAPGHFELKMDSGDTLEFWLTVEDGEVSLKGARPGHLEPAEADYIYTIRPDGTAMRSAGISLPGLNLNQEGEVMM